jgi:hypothetical protein
MTFRAEDIMDDVEEGEDAPYEEIEDALGEDELAERRKGRRQPRGRGYANPRIEKSFVTQAQLQAATARIGKDIRTVGGNVSAVDTRLSRFRRDTSQAMQMSALLPLLLKPKTVTTTVASGGIPAGTKVLIDDGDTMTAMLPLLMMGGMAGGNGANGGSSAGGMDPMMMFALVMAMDRPRTAIT